MTPTWGDKLGSSGRTSLGVGVRVTPESVPTPRIIHYSNFRFGLMLADRPGDVPEGYYPKALDIETTRSDGVQRARPINVIENTGHFLNHLFVRPSLDFQSELVAIDPPWVGIRQGGTIVWYNLGSMLDPTPDVNWVASVYGDTLVISNGRKSYARPDSGFFLQTVDEMPGAATIFTAFGRIFAGGTLTPSGEYNVLGLMWNGVSGDFTDWTGLGSGGELLLSDVQQADRIIAGRIMSYDTVAILCRRSIWIANRTGEVDRPADPQFRLSGIGCVFEKSACTTERGVTFLSDEGVRHFDGQKAEIISGPINRELLPIAFDEISSYKAVWDGGRRRYILCAPCCTYVYQFPTPEYPQGAWFKKTIAFTNVIPFAQQTDDPTWTDFEDLVWDSTGSVGGGPPPPPPPPVLSFSYFASRFFAHRFFGSRYFG